MVALEKILKQYWGYNQFRPYQKEVISSILAGKNTLAILPTGSGKSVGYQLPALITKGVCLVISPLIALMKDQVHRLNDINIPAAALYSGMNHEESATVYRRALDEEIKLLYISPERLQSERFIRFLNNANISFLAVDEAHCIAQWGHDFRPAYLNIKEVKHLLPNKPILALTATATPRVQEEIIERLRLNQAQIFQGYFLRNELSLAVYKVENKLTQLIALVKSQKRSIIIYCRNRRSCKDLAVQLQQEGIRTGYYHAGLSKEERTNAQEDWIENKVQCIVCTNAFGMGIDKADVGLVAHYDLPESLEAYYQEVGRAGRDGIQSQGVVLYNSNSLQKQKEQAALKFPDEEQLRQLYADVCSYLKIPVGAGEEEYFDFNLLDFVKTTGYNLITAVHGIQLLAKQNIWHLSDSLYMPLRVQVQASREELQHIETNYHRQYVLLKQLLRSYNGIWQHAVPINEYELAAKIKKPVQQIKEDLHFLASRAYIKCWNKKDQPQLYMTDQRYPASQIVINYKEILWHKKREEERLDALQAFVKNNSICRMQLLNNYFIGDKSKQEKIICGHCDVDKVKVVDVSFESVKNLLDKALTNKESENLENIIGHLASEERAQSMKLIRIMISEGMYAINAFGELNKK